MNPSPDNIRADRGELSQAAYAALAGLSRGAIANAEAGTLTLRPASWRLLRATRALQRGDTRGALAILSEGLVAPGSP